MEITTYDLPFGEPADDAEREQRRARLLQFTSFLEMMRQFPGRLPSGPATIAAALAAEAGRLWPAGDMPPSIADLVRAHRVSEGELQARMEALRAEQEAMDAEMRSLRPEPYGDAESAALGRLPERALFFALQANLDEPSGVRADEVMLAPDDAPVPLADAMRRVASLPRLVEFTATRRGAHMVVEAAPMELEQWQARRHGRDYLVTEMLPNAARELGAPEAVLLRGEQGTLLLPRDAFAAWLFNYGVSFGYSAGDAGPEDVAAGAALVMDLSSRG